MGYKPRTFRRDVCQINEDYMSVREYYAAQTRKKRKIIKTIFNYTAPVIAAVAFIFVVNYWTGIDYNVTKADSVQYFSQSAEIETAEDPATYSIAVSSSNKSIDDVLLESANDVVEEAAGLYIDGEFVAATSSASELQLMLDGILDEKQTTPDSEVVFVEDVTYEPGVFISENVDDVDEIKELITSETDKDSETDDSGTVSDKDKSGKLVSSNKTVTVKETIKVTRTETIAYETEETEDKSLEAGTTKIKTEGAPGEKEIVEEIIIIDGKETSRKIIKENVTKNPVTKELLVGTKITPGKSTGQFMWPVNGGTITSLYGARWGGTHKGLDIAAPKGTSVYAADGGTVEVSRWYYGYGYAVIINHGNGYKTLYGHNSSLIAKEGQKVSKGELIALVGTTGNSTGNHCHFEVILNGNHQNPLNYISN